MDRPGAAPARPAAERRRGLGASGTTGRPASRRPRARTMSAMSPDAAPNRASDKIARVLDRARRRRAARRSRDRCAVRGARSRLRACRARPPTSCAQPSIGDAVDLRRQAQHQLHEHLPATTAASARSPKARRTRRCAALPYRRGPATRSARRVREAWERGATEVCMQGGIHPRFTGETYLAICRAAKEAVPQIHVHAFSPLEVRHGARTLGHLGRARSCASCKAAGLGSLPGTAAEILDDESGASICPDKVTTAGMARRGGGSARARPARRPRRSCSATSRHTCTGRGICCGCADSSRTRGGFTEFVPLPFVHMEAPLYSEGSGAQGTDVARGHPDACRRAPGAASALPQHPGVLGQARAALGAGRACAAGANDLGGTLMNEIISRAAGAAHGQELAPQRWRS